MGKYVIEGGRRLAGEVAIHGAKNSVLPILAATLLVGECTIHNCPNLSDVDAAFNILRHLGCTASRDGDTVSVSARTLADCTIPDELMRGMRSSVIFLGAILARCGKARISMPGGCELGRRPINLHILALEKMGVTIEEDHGYLNCTVEKGLRGAEIPLLLPSVGATENILLAACMAKGKTVVHNSAREPEIVDLVNFLQGAGANIHIDKNGTITVNGVAALHGTEHTVIPDRIAAATYLCCAAITGGEVLLRGAMPQHMTSVFPVLKEAGCTLRHSAGNIFLSAQRRPRPLSDVQTMPYPGFPTDALSPAMALASVARGTSYFRETIFENRYKMVAELSKMGAKVKIDGRMAVIEGVSRLHSAPLCCTDLRGGAALCCAALAAEGESYIADIHHIERGYQDFDKNLRSLGAIIDRC